MDLPVRPLAPFSLTELQRSIRARIREFDVPALLDLLAAIGYDPAEIVFRGHVSASPQPSMLHDIELLAAPTPVGLPRGTVGAVGAAARELTPPKVEITMNLGLLSCRSPLPSYLLRLCHALETSDPLIELLRLLDRSLLATRLTADRPERLLASWGDVRRDFLSIHGLDSPLGLHWLFRNVFPELGVRVFRQTDDYRVPFAGARLGFSSLGRCAFGTTTRLTVHDVEVTLVSGEPTHEGSPWPRVADLRIRRFVLPLLDEVCMNLTIAFVLLDRSTYARLDPASYVGYDPMWGIPDATLVAGLPPTRIVLYRGALPLTEPGTDELDQALAAGDGDRLRLEPRRWDQPRAPGASALPSGSVLELSLVYVPDDGRSFTYDVEVRWGVRAWYSEEPFEISLTFEGMPKAGPDPSHHPTLWPWLRDEARAQLANRVVIETMALEPDAEEHVSLELVERLIEHGERERLHALAWSKLTPLEQWDHAAWQRYLDWNGA
jgi:hypothetical protein